MPKPSKAEEQARELTLVTRWSWSVIAGMAAVLAVVSWVSWPGPPAEPPPRAREFRDYDVCLLTDQHGTAGAQAAKVWAGLREVSDQTGVRRSFLSVPGEQSQARVAQFVATQVQQGCDIVVAVGEQQVATVTALAGKHSKVHFVVVGGTSSGGNLTNVDAGGVAAHVMPLIP